MICMFNMYVWYIRIQYTSLQCIYMRYIYQPQSYVKRLKDYLYLLLLYISLYTYIIHIIVYIYIIYVYEYIYDICMIYVWYNIV